MCCIIKGNSNHLADFTSVQLAGRAFKDSYYYDNENEEVVQGYTNCFLGVSDQCRDGDGEQMFQVLISWVQSWGKMFRGEHSTNQ